MQQLHWAQYFVKRWNKAKANKNQQIKLVQGDTQLGVDTAFAVKVAHSFASNSKVLAVVGPAGSQEVVASTSAYKGGGLGFVSGSATRVTLTDGHTDGNRNGFFFRAVPNDGVQAPTVAKYMTSTLKWKRVYIIDDQETYSQGLADGVQKILQGKGVSVTRNSISQTASDFSSVIAKIPANTQGVYIPWQLAPQAQAFGQQLKAAGKSHVTLFGSDGLFSPDWKIAGSYDSFFPVNTGDATVQGFVKSHGGDGQFFGAPSYVAAAGRHTGDHQGVQGRARQDEPGRSPQADREDEAQVLDPGLPGLVREGRRSALAGQLRHLSDPEERLVQAGRLARQS